MQFHSSWKTVLRLYLFQGLFFKHMLLQRSFFHNELTQDFIEYLLYERYCYCYECRTGKKPCYTHSCFLGILPGWSHSQSVLPFLCWLWNLHHNAFLSSVPNFHLAGFFFAFVWILKIILTTLLLCGSSTSTVVTISPYIEKCVIII